MADLIDRQAAIDHAVPLNLFGREVMMVSVSELENLPSAQPERMRGKWIDAVLPNDNGGLPVQVCDQCNTFFPLAYTGGGHRFCPSCGAKMEVEHDKDDVLISGYCSCCGWESIIMETDVADMPFCPNCGADMRGEQDGH